MKKFYITTPIYYASGNLHLGHAFTTLYADVLNRYKKLIGCDTFFLTGSDEHGQKLQDAAKKENLTPQQLVDRNTELFKELWVLLGIDYSHFIRTTDDYHKITIQKIIEKLFDKGYIYLDKWEGLYCVSCEENYTETSSVKKDNELYCKVGHKLTSKNEESYFLKLSLFKEWIEKYLTENKDFIYPENRARELINNFLKDGKLEDLSISRTTFDWGIKFKNNPNHVVYVWIDALSNYITALGYEQNNDDNFKKYWMDKECEKVHIIGKEITRFHCIYWPIMLKMLDLPLPNKIISHGWIITSEGKMSKSLGNVINPIDFINKYGRDAFRYYLMKEISVSEDSVFSEKQFIGIFNNDLANNYGNIISRTIGMLEKYTNGIIPEFKNVISEHDLKILNKRNELIECYESMINNFEISKLINKICEFENEINLYVENTKPWVLFKENKIDEINVFLNLMSNSIRLMIALLEPLLIDTTLEACSQFGFSKSHISLSDIENLNLISGIKVQKGKNLFERIKVDEN